MEIVINGKYRKKFFVLVEHKTSCKWLYDTWLQADILSFY